MKAGKFFITALLSLSLSYGFAPKNNPKPHEQDSFTKAISNIFQETPITPKDILNTLTTFYDEFKGGQELLKKAEGYLVFPNVYDAGFVVGGKYGYGALVKNDTIAYYYKIYSTSVGLKAGVQRFSLIVVFLTKESLKRFLNKEEWKVGLDSKLTFTSWHEGVDVNSLDLKKDTLIIPFNQVGIMANVSFEGTVFQKLN